MKSRRRVILVVGVLLLAFALRTIGAPSRSLWYDEAFSVLFSSLNPTQMIRAIASPVEATEAVEVHPPLYPFLLHLWIGLSGTSPFAVRLLSIFLGILTVACLWRLADWAFNWRTGLATGLLAAINPFHIAYSQETRMYTLLTLTTVIAAWGFLRALESRNRSRRWMWWGLYAAAAALTMYTHSMGAFTLLTINLLAGLRRGWWHSLPALITANLAAVTLYSPWLVGVLPRQLGFVSSNYWLEVPGVAELLRTVMLPVFTYYEPASLGLLVLELFTGLLTLVLLLLQVSKRRSRASWFLFLGWVPIGLMFVASLWKPLYLERALLSAALFYLVAVGWLVAHRRLPHALRAMLVTLLAVTIAASLYSHYTYVGFPRPSFSEAIAYLEEHRMPGDAIIHPDKSTVLSVHYYAPHLPDAYLADPPGFNKSTLSIPTQEALGILATSTITEAVGGADRVWMIYFPHEMEAIRQLAPEYSAHIWIETHFLEVERETFGGLVVSLHERVER